MLSTSLWATLLASSPLSVAAYSVIDTYDSTNWLQKFDFFNGTDPTHGFVNYLTQGETGFDDLFSTDGGQVSMKVDSSTNNLPTNGPGRASVRVTSQASYGINTLIVLDAAHMPIGCGTWPAFWTVGNQTLQKWPKGGEIDIIEGVNNQQGNAMTLHTNQSCSMPTTKDNLLSNWGTDSNCDCTSGPNVGCGRTTQQTNTYGSGFNDGNGGVYAMEWTTDAISIWFFPHSNVPSNVQSDSPDPSSWSAPLARFPNNNCDLFEHFQQQQIVFDTTFCGDWAGESSVWASSGCSSQKYPTCQSFVADQGLAFSNAYWTVRSLKVYGNSGSSNSGGSGSAPTTYAGLTTASVHATTATAQANPTVSLPVSQPVQVSNPAPSQTWWHGGHGKYNGNSGTHNNIYVNSDSSSGGNAVNQAAGGQLQVEAPAPAETTAASDGALKVSEDGTVFEKRMSPFVGLEGGVILGADKRRRSAQNDEETGGEKRWISRLAREKLSRRPHRRHVAGF